MAKEKTVNFAGLQSGTELETPLGVGKFITYKEGNFKAQNVLVEHTPCKLKWYTEKELKLADTINKVVGATREANQQAFMKEFFYYSL